MVEPGCAKTLPQSFRERLLVAEHDALDDAAPVAVQARGDRAGQALAQAVGDAAEPAPTADDAPAVCAQHDMDAVAP